MGKKSIEKINKAIGWCYDNLLSLKYDYQYHNLLRRQSNPSHISKNDLKQYKRKWGNLGMRVNPIYLKLFSQYCGVDLNIIPEDISHNIIENILCPPLYRAYFEDKNMFDSILGQHRMPQTYLRCIDGKFYDASYTFVDQNADINLYEVLKPYKEFVIKPTRNSSSGNGVTLYTINLDAKHRIIPESISFRKLREIHGDNFIVQQRLEQSVFMSQFSNTSINTLRLLVYKSVVDDRCHLINGCIRIGQAGSFLDNAHQGGKIVGLDIHTGELGDYLINQYGDRFTEHNGIDFSKKHFVVTDMNAIRKFSEDLCSDIPYHRCFNLDVMIDKAGIPKLIEFNISAMGIWAYQFLGNSCFGEYTDEIIDYCRDNLNRKQSQYLFI